MSRRSSVRRMGMVAFATLSVGALRPTPVAAQKSFEGVIIAESYVNRQTQVETLFVKGSHWRFAGFEQGRGEKGAAYVGDDKDQFLLLIPSRRVYLRQPIGTDADAAQDLVTFTKAGRSESVAGTQCEYYTMRFRNTDKMDRQFCIATDLGFVGFTPEVRVHEGAASLGIGVVARRKFPDGFLVLKAIDKSGKVVFAATKVERKPVGDDLFQPGAGWSEAPTRPAPPR